MGKDSKGFLCFKPSPTIEIDTDVDCSANRVLTYFAALKNKSKEMRREKKKKKKKKTLKGTRALSEYAVQTPALDCREYDPSSNHDRKSSTGLIRAVMFVTNKSRRKARESRSSQKCPESTSQQSVKKVDDQSSSCSFPMDPICSNYDHSPQVTEKAVGATAEHSSSQRDDADDGKRKQLLSLQIGGFRINQVLWLVLFSLWMTVFWGKILAVMTTTTVGIYACRENRRWAGLRNDDDMLEKDKKKKTRDRLTP